MMNLEPKPKLKPEKIVKIKKRKVKSARALLVGKLDSACRDIILDRDYSCVCVVGNGHKGPRTSGHLISRTRESVRWDLYNIHEQCGGHNMLHEYQPERFTSWFLGKFGVDQYARLVQDAEKVSKLQLYELQELLDQLKKIRQRQIVETLAGNPWKPYFSQKDILSGAWSK
jgi:hypothetical protein